MNKESHGQSDIGLERDHNEDSFCVSDQYNLYAIADGMGGHTGGHVASEIAINTIKEFFRNSKEDEQFESGFNPDPKLSEIENLLLAAIKTANRKIYDYAREEEEYAGMGTTIVGLHIQDSTAVIANVGDSRCYHLRGFEFIQLSTDHTWVNEQLKRNIISAEEARSHRWRNVITRALGTKRYVDVDIRKIKIQPGDLFLLCSDGLSNVLPDEDILSVMIKHGENVEEACGELIRLAREGGGPDNITVVIVRITD